MLTNSSYMLKESILYFYIYQSPQQHTTRKENETKTNHCDKLFYVINEKDISVNGVLFRSKICW